MLPPKSRGRNTPLQWGLFLSRLKNPMGGTLSIPPLLPQAGQKLKGAFKLMYVCPDVSRDSSHVYLMRERERERAETGGGKWMKHSYWKVWAVYKKDQSLCGGQCWCCGGDTQYKSLCGHWEAWNVWFIPVGQRTLVDYVVLHVRPRTPKKLGSMQHRPDPESQTL